MANWLVSITTTGAQSSPSWRSAARALDCPAVCAAAGVSEIDACRAASLAAASTDPWAIVVRPAAMTRPSRPSSTGARIDQLECGATEVGLRGRHFRRRYCTPERPSGPCSHAPPVSWPELFCRRLHGLGHADDKSGDKAGDVAAHRDRYCGSRAARSGRLRILKVALARLAGELSAAAGPAARDACSTRAASAPCRAAASAAFLARNQNEA